jgi:hypothetical protein
VVLVTYIYPFPYHNKTVLGRYIIIEFKLSLCSGKGKCKCVLLHTVEVNGGCRVIAPLVLNLGTMWRREANFTLWSLYPRETLIMGRGRPQSRVGRRGGNFSSFNFDCTAWVVAMPSEWGVSTKGVVVAEWRYFGRV